MAKVLKADCAAGDAYASKAVAFTSHFWVEYDVYVPAATLTAIVGGSSPDYFTAAFADFGEGLFLSSSDGVTWNCWADNDPNPASGVFTAGAWHTVRIELEYLGGSVWHSTFTLDGGALFNYSWSGASGIFTSADLRVGGFSANHIAGEVYYLDNVKVGTTAGGTDLFQDDFESGTFAAWDSETGSVTIIDDPFAVAAPVGRVLIAFDDTPLEPDPVWTRIDDTDNLVASYDITTGKQTELDRTDTGTATVFLNDTAGLFDPLNTGSPYFGKIVGKQILLQLWNPVTSEWVQEWRGKIRNYNYAITPVLGADGKPIVVHVQVDCVDIFDYLGGYGLQPGVNGDTPPAGSEGIVFYEDTAGTVDDRIIQALTDGGVDSTRYVVFSGNVKVQESKYDPGDALLNVLRDAADAEFPGLANIYVDRFGRFVFHGRYARFDPEGVIAAGPVSTVTWDFHRWKVGDGTAITGDSDYAQIRVLAYTHGEDDIVNSAISWPAGMADTDMPGQVFEDATSITNHGKHSLPPMGDLIISEGSTTGNTAKVECQKFAEFFVHYLKDPQTRLTDLMVKAIAPTDPRAASTWDVLTKADISDIMRTTVGYPGGTGIDSDNYIEGYTKRVRPLNPTHDYVEVEFNLTPTAWALDPDGILAPAS